MRWLKRLIAMARKGIVTLTGLTSGGGGGGTVEPNPPGSVTPPPPSAGTQNTALPLVASTQTLFNTTVTRTLISPQSVVMSTTLASTQTIFQPTVSISSTQRTVVLPLVTSPSFVLNPAATIAGTFVETFALASGSNWDSARWTNKRVTTGALGDVQTGTGRLTTGTLTNYTGASGYMTVNSYSNFELTGDLLIQTADVCYPMIGFRSSTSWAPTHASAQDSYWLEIKRNELGTYLYKRNGNTPTLVGSNSNFSYTTGDTIHFKVNCNGTTLRTRMWKNSATEPTTWDMQITDTNFTSGRIYLAVNGGPDAATDEIRWDNITIVGSATTDPPPIIPPPTTTSLVRTGMTWTGFPPDPTVGTNLASLQHLTVMAQHIIGFGAENGIELNPAPGVYNWGAFDPAFNRMMSCSPAKPIIIFCRAPGWSGVTQDDLPVLPAFFQAYADLCAAVAARYPQVTYFSVWNEMKGFWNPAQNRWDYEGYTAMYNAIWTKVKAVRPTCKIGGPYVILQSGSTGTSWSHGPTTATFPGGSHDLRQIQVMQYFAANALGYDFLSCDGGIENQFGAQFGADPHQQLEKLWGWWKWVRQNIHPTVELINFETYVNQTVTLGYTEAQRQDLWIELCQKTLDNVPNPNVSYLSWGSPGFRPQVIGGVTDFVWNNADSGFGAKVTAFEGTSSPPPASGTVWNVPAQGTLQAVADAAAPGDTIYLTGTIDVPSKALVIANKRNGSLGQTPITIIGNPGSLLRCQESGIEGYGSNRGWWFFNVNVQVNAASYYGEGFYFAGYRTDFGGDGQGCTNIRIIGCTVRPIPGTGSNVQRNGINVWGCDGAVEIGNCDISNVGWNDNGFFGGAGSGISCGQSQTITGAPLLPNGAQLWIHGNKVRSVYGPGTASADRNACILDGYHGWDIVGGSNVLRSSRAHGACIIEANDFADCEGRGIQILCAGADDSQVIIRNNLLRGYMATNLDTSAPFCGIGGYGAGPAGNLLVNTNDVQVTGAQFAYQFISFNSYGGVTGSGNIGQPRSFDGSPGNSPPPGF